MLYAAIAVIALLLLFLLVSFFLTYKNYSFKIDENEIKVQNRGAHLKIFIDGKLHKDYFMPQLIKGEEFKVPLNDKEVTIKCKTSSLGYKMRVEVSIDENFITDNGVKLKEKNKLKEIDIDKDIKSKIEISTNEKEEKNKAD